MSRIEKNTGKKNKLAERDLIEKLKDNDKKPRDSKKPKTLARKGKGDFFGNKPKA